MSLRGKGRERVCHVTTTTMPWTVLIGVGLHDVVGGFLWECADERKKLMQGSVRSGKK